MKISKQQQHQFINIFFIFLSSILLFIFLYIPIVKRIMLNNREIIDLRNTVNKLAQIDKDPLEFKNSKNKVNEELNKINEKVTLKPMIAQVIEQITKPIKETGLYLVAITPLEPVSKGGVSDDDESLQEETDSVSDVQEEEISTQYHETSIELRLQGTYEQFGIYLNRLRNIQRLIRVEEFNIKNDKSITPKLDIKLKISVFHYGKE